MNSLQEIVLKISIIAACVAIGVIIFRFAFKCSHKTSCSLENHAKVWIKNILNYRKPSFWLAITMITAFIVLAVILTANPKKSFDLEKVKANAELFSTTETDLIEIGKAAFNHYNSSFMGDDIPKEYRITKYKLNDISLAAGDENEFCLRVVWEYSTTGLYFLSSNGNFVPNGTGGECTNDRVEYRIKNLGNHQYKVVSIGTGGGTQGLVPVNAEDLNNFIQDRIDLIISSPKEASNPQDYITAHQTEYDAIIALDSKALPYLFSEFEKGSQTGLKGKIMEKLCRQILGGEDIKYANADPQDWYDTLKAHIKNIKTKNSLEFVKKSYPKASLILETDI